MTRRIERVRFVRKKNAQRVRAAGPAECAAQGVFKIWRAGGQLVCDQVRQDLGVRLGTKGVTPGFQLPSQFLVIFDDAVVNDRDPARGIGMGMRVDVRRLAVRGPAGVPYAGGAGKRGVVKLAFKVAQPADALPDVQTSVFKRGDPGGIVTAVFETLEPLDQHGHRVPTSHISNNATHQKEPPITFLRGGRMYL